jgi:phosphatidylglycerol---prolipoprotein diacylglyceryl transferase
MRPVLFRFRGIEIRSYPFFLFLGLTVGIIAGTRAGARNGLDPTRLYISLALLIIAALIGSRLMYVLTRLDYYRKNPSEVLKPSASGAAMYGGIILALVCSWPLLRLTQINLGKFWDAATITLLVGMIFTRIGCVLNGCCAGRATSSWIGVNLPDENGIYSRRFPTQLLEAAIAVVLLTAALSWANRPFDGALFLVSLGIFCSARLALGPTRENLGTVAGINTYDAGSVLLILVSIAGLLAHAKAK